EYESAPGLGIELERCGGGHLLAIEGIAASGDGGDARVSGGAPFCGNAHGVGPFGGGSAGAPARHGDGPGWCSEVQAVGGGTLVAASADGIGGDDLAAACAPLGGVDESEVIVFVVPQHLGAVVGAHQTDLGSDDAVLGVEVEAVEQGSGLAGHGVSFRWCRGSLPRGVLLFYTHRTSMSVV